MGGSPHDTVSTGRIRGVRLDRPRHPAFAPALRGPVATSGGGGDGRVLLLPSRGASRDPAWYGALARAVSRRCRSAHAPHPSWTAGLSATALQPTEAHRRSLHA